jgi:hypothetical protein
MLQSKIYKYLVLILVLGQNIKKPVKFIFYITLVFLNYSMLALGYLGEINIIPKLYASIIGFIPFFIVFYLIYITFIKNHNLFINNVIFYLYLSIWSLYGVVYLFDEELKNICFNILDLIATLMVVYILPIV